jgi:glutamyl-tRNA reductase
MEQFARQLTNKLIHKPCLELREAGAEGREEVIEIVKALYVRPGSSGE